MTIAERTCSTDLASAGLAAALEAIGAPSFIADAHGRLLHANDAGRRLWEADPAGTGEILAGAPLGKTGGGVEYAQLDALPAWLLVLRAQPLEARLARVARAWALTPRQADVLRLVAQGDTNKAIAAALGCAEVTVELHVSAILRKAHVDRRAALTAAFWRG
jgi:DNA-binding CsgD family transcriptional regulator